VSTDLTLLSRVGFILFPITGYVVSKNSITVLLGSVSILFKLNFEHKDREVFNNYEDILILSFDVVLSSQSNWAGK
jgi:hypothetical protein